MTEDKMDNVGVEQESNSETPNPDRREFVSKLVTAAGMIAVAGLAGAASADVGKISSGEYKDQAVFHKVGKLRNGFSMVFSGRPIGQALIDAGIAPAGTPLENATIKIEFTA